MRANSVVKIECKSIDVFLKHWIDFTHPLHKLTEKEKVIFNFLLRKYFELSKTVKEDSLLNTLLFGKGVRDECLEQQHISKTYFYVTLHNLRKKKVLLENSINPKLIPTISTEGENKSSALMIYFSIE